MKLALNFSLFLSVLFVIGEKSFSLSDYQIKEICQKDRKKLSCIKKLQEKKSNLQKGNLIEIPVIPYSR